MMDPRPPVCIELLDHCTLETVSRNPDKLFVFEDTFAQTGEAALRRLPNAFGIPVKKYPSMNRHAFLDDRHYAVNCERIDAAIRRIREAGYSTIVLPARGVGARHTRLSACAPRTFQYLQEQIRLLREPL